MGGGIRAALLVTQGLFAREQTLAERASLSPLEEGIPFEPVSLIRGESRGMRAYGTPATQPAIALRRSGVQIPSAPPMISTS